MGTLDGVPEAYTRARQQQAQQNPSNPCNETWAYVGRQERTWYPPEAAYDGSGYSTSKAYHGPPDLTPHAAQPDYHASEGFSTGYPASALLHAPSSQAPQSHQHRDVGVPVNAPSVWHAHATPAPAPQPRHFTNASAIHPIPQQPAQRTTYETQPNPYS
ncbi:uncharacterized protein BKCO1_19000183 [Diplodia corticola]|uniref:Uncharacterized protein n=1 Tax=Diplodia corticola TaxID=236234 RepID=A0A1J9R3D7_9PEZI|nr:uncharacterized protein BKCO1_19000183 [Diplodia corticola]OJD35128.1 hypothetical protein BKCO1_19000183 [Diplodia corticola]